MPSPQPNLPKTFRKLKNYTSKVAQFVLQWQDLEDYFQSIKAQLEHLETIHKTHTQQSLIPYNSSKPPIQSQIAKPPLQTLDKNAEIESDSTPIDSGESLVELLKERILFRGAVSEALQSTSNPGKQVLEVLRLFYPPSSSKIVMGVDLSVVRLNCVVFLEELKRLGCVVDSEVRKEAIEMGLDWESKMKSALEVLGFLTLVDVFGLVDEFYKDKIFKHFDKVVQREQAPKLLRSLGFSDKADEFVQKLIVNNKRLDAIPFIYAFELVDKFPPVPLLRAHSVHAEETSARIYEKRRNSLSALDHATGTRVAALRGILNVIKKFKLHSEYSAESVRTEIKQVKKRRDKIKKSAETSSRRDEPQVQIGNKRDTPSKAIPDQHDTTKRPKIAENAASTSVNLTHHSIYIPNVQQLSSPVFGHSAQQSVQPSGQYNFAGFAHQRPEDGYGVSAPFITSTVGQYGYVYPGLNTSSLVLQNRSDGTDAGSTGFPYTIRHWH